jgi:hypothetical protein
MLNLLKVAGQMQGISEQLQKEAKQLSDKLSRAEILFQAAIANQAQLTQHHQQWRDRLAFNCAEPIESLKEIRSIPIMASAHTVLATDGSQIAPSRHEIAYCYLINVGRVALHYGSGAYPLLDSFPEVYYKPEDLYGARKWGIQTEEWMTFKRTVAEAIALAELADLSLPAPTEDTYEVYPTLALSDGSLIHWELDPLPKEARSKILPDILSAWDRLRMAGIPLASYISSPRTVESINFLRLQACTFAQPDCATHCANKLLDHVPCSQVQPLRDATLWHKLLQPGECSPLWRSHASILQEYGDHAIYFCYLHVGSEVARVEMPAWTALDEQLRLRSLGIILAQVQKGYGYPVALAEAHNQAVVTGSDRHRFFAILETQMIKAGMRNVTTSFKEARKRGSIA